MGGCIRRSEVLCDGFLSQGDLQGGIGVVLLSLLTVEERALVVTELMKSIISSIRTPYSLLIFSCAFPSCLVYGSILPENWKGEDSSGQ
jgi:hypothetical protein